MQRLDWKNQQQVAQLESPTWAEVAANHPGGVTGLSAKMRRSSMGVTGLPGGVPDGDVTGGGDQGEVGQKK